MDHTLWIHQIYVICAASEMPQAIGALDIAFPCDDGKPRDPSRPDDYAAQYSANGQPLGIYYGAAFVVTEEVRQRLEDLGLAQTPGIVYWRSSNPEGILAATNRPDDQGFIGQPWAWDDCLNALGLKPVELPIDALIK